MARLRAPAALRALALAALIAGSAGCALAQLLQSGSESDGTSSETPVSDAGPDANVTGAGCGTESQSGATLCRATSTCPSVVVDSDAFPHCGFRIRGSVSELVCACGELLCSMGSFTTCTSAAELLLSQTEQGVCLQVNEGRCSPARGTSSGGAGGASSGSSSGGNPACDRQCMSECGGGSACASVCNCD